MPDFVFVGVTTSSSLVHQALRAWQPILGVPCNVRGIDIRLDSDDHAYVEFLDGLPKDDSVAGAVHHPQSPGIPGWPRGLQPSGSTRPCL